MKNKLILILLISSISVPAFAEFITNSEVYLGIGGYRHDSKRELNDAAGFEAGFELPVAGSLSWDLWYSRYSANSKKLNSNASVHVRRLYQGFLYHLNKGLTRAFVIGGYGTHNFSGPGISNDDDFFNFGAGVKSYLKSNIILRGEVLTLHKPDFRFTDMGARLSIGYVFGQKYVRPEEIPPVIEPEPAPIPKPAPEPLDSDNDGVIDGTDECPGTDIAFKVDQKGCPIKLIETVSRTLDVKFAFNSAVLTKEYYPEVQKLADFMNQFDKIVVVIEGHSDSRGKSAYNKALSQRRADAVRQVLIKDFGLPESRVTAIGYGEEKPIADNATPEGRAINRRVVAVVESTIETISKK